MDQPKIERMLRVMQLLSGNINYTIDELADKLGLSRRSIFRYIDTFRNAGFAVTRISEGTYKMTSYNKEYTDISQLVYFSEEEAIIVSRLIENLSSINAVKSGLKRKLAAVYDATSMSEYIDHKGTSDTIELLSKAIKEKRQVSLKGYASNNAGKPKDYVLEPYTFTNEYMDIWAYDTVAGKNKTFKLSRIGEMELLGPWELEDAHHVRPIDAFRMSGDPVERVRLKMTLRAKNLLAEEFPVTSGDIVQEKHAWYWEGDVNALEGVGRFVLGLPDDISVEEGTRLKAWLVEKGATIQRKFR